MRSSEANVLPFKVCKKRKRWKSDGARSGLYGGWMFGNKHFDMDDADIIDGV